MDFETYLEHSTTDLNTKQKVGLAFYYLIEEENKSPVEVREVSELLKYSPANVNQNSVRAYPSQIADQDGHLKPIDDEGYLLTTPGRSYYEDLVDLPNKPTSPREDQFIGLTRPDEEFYGPLIDEIETAYRYHLYNSTLVMTRKLFENLLIDILRGHFGVSEKEKRDLYFNDDRAMFRDFSVLVDNFEVNLDEFRPYMPDLDSEFIDSLNQFRHRANASTHSITVEIDGPTIENVSEDASDISKRLFRLREQVKIAAETWDEDAD